MIIKIIIRKFIVIFILTKLIRFHFNILDWFINKLIKIIEIISNSFNLLNLIRDFKILIISIRLF